MGESRSAAMAKKKPLYGVHPGVAMMQEWVATLKDKSGRSLDEWIALLKAEGPAMEKERRDWLKSKYKMGTNSSWWIAARIEGKDSWDDDPEAYLKQAEVFVEQM